MEFDRSISPEQRHIIERDLENLCRLNYDLKNREMDAAKRVLQMVFEIEEVSCERLKNWLHKRVKWITGNFDFGDRVIIQRQESSWWNSLDWSLFYFVQEWKTERNMNHHARAMNFGATLFGILKIYDREQWFSSYRFGEFETWFKFIRDDGREILLPITTPRVGIIRLAENFFLSQYHPNSSKVDSLGNSLFRMGLLFHEARHSDGHGEHTIFPHDAPCSQTAVAKESRSGCDSALNGAYGIEFTFLNYAIQACDRCSEKEKDILIQHAVWVSKRANMKSSKFLDASPIELPRLRQLP